MKDHTDQAGQDSSLREPISRKEREKRAREMEILKAARDLFVANGFRETTLDEIARHAEFGKGTIYNYFASKEELFLGIIDQTMDEVLAICNDAIAVPGDAREKFLRYASGVIRYVKENGELLHVIYHELHRGSSTVNVTKLREILDRARRGWEVLARPLTDATQNRLAGTCDPVQLAVLFDGMLRGYCFHRFSIEGSQQVEDYSDAAELITSVFFDGIAERTHEG
ncbi:MAG: TetR/AcrR family transcriptional regulator [Bacteroidetes bacterium]|nr:TetR/AcrR family transcriptional regulator [Bacteroidota bacterium]